MKLTHFTYQLPDELIAQHPSPERDKSRLLVIHRSTGTITHDHFFNLGQYLPLKSSIVLNNSKVVPARLLGHKSRSGGKVEIFLLKKSIHGPVYETLMRPMSKIKNGDEIVFEGSSLTAKVIDIEKRLVHFNRLPSTKDLKKVGHMPLPPYIRRPAEVKDHSSYQTVYARHNGSVAAPTAGLHFTKALLARLKKAGHTLTQVTLHVNYGTFKPVEVEDIRNHQMHEETYEISSTAYTRVKKARAQHRPIVAIGTTSCRVLESVHETGRLQGSTKLFIYPGYQFKMVDALLTNFHLPQSTLLMLVYAFGGMDLMKKAYAEAIKHKYRFYSYGDAMLIL